MAVRMTVRAPAKVNLCLSVGDVRPDGFHAVDTVMHALALADDIVVVPGETLSVSCEPSVGVPEERNLAYRAAVAFGDHFGDRPAVSVHVTKRIPHGAGLGGGSSDAAAVITALAKLAGVERTDPRCLAAAASVGCDVAFFLHGPAARMAGRGDELVSVLTPLDAPVLLVRPNLPVPTGGAYAAFDADPQAGLDCEALLGALRAGDRHAVADAVANNLELAAATVVPEVASALAWTRRQPGVLSALLAGSGSAVFALLEDDAPGESLTEQARSRGWWSGLTCLDTVGMKIEFEEGT